MRENETRDLEVYFKIQDVDYYEIKFVNEKTQTDLEIPEMYRDLTNQEVVLGTLLTFLIFW